MAKVKVTKLKIPSMEELLEAGVHFGHQTRRWNPKMKKYIYTSRQGIHVLDLAETRKALIEAGEFLREQAAAGKRIVFLATKRQAAPVVEQEAQRAGVFYLTQRWVGGLITNFSQTQKPIQRLAHIKEVLGDQEQQKDLTTKEHYELKSEEGRLMKLVGGLQGLDERLEVLVLVDPVRETTGVREARHREIPIVALLDTNGDPELIDYPIPGNDDGLRSIELIVKALADAVIEGKTKRGKLKTDTVK